MRNDDARVTSLHVQLRYRCQRHRSAQSVVILVLVDSGRTSDQQYGDSGIHVSVTVVWIVTSHARIKSRATVTDLPYVLSHLLVLQQDFLFFISCFYSRPLAPMADMTVTKGGTVQPRCFRDVPVQPLTPPDHEPPALFIDNLRTDEDAETILLPRPDQLAFSGEGGLSRSSREHLKPKPLNISPTKTNDSFEEEDVEQQAYHDVVNEVQKHVEHFSPVIFSRVPRPKIVSPAITGGKAQQVLGLNAAE